MTDITVQDLRRDIISALHDWCKDSVHLDRYITAFDALAAKAARTDALEAVNAALKTAYEKRGETISDGAQEILRLTEMNAALVKERDALRGTDVVLYVDPLFLEIARQGKMRHIHCTAYQQPNGDATAPVIVQAHDKAAQEPECTCHPDDVPADGCQGCYVANEYEPNTSVRHIDTLLGRIDSGECAPTQFEYQRTFDAIAAATRISGGAISISVLDFAHAYFSETHQASEGRAAMSTDERAAVDFYARNPSAALFDLRNRVSPSQSASVGLTASALALTLDNASHEYGSTEGDAGYFDFLARAVLAAHPATKEARDGVKE